MRIKKIMIIGSVLLCLFASTSAKKVFCSDYVSKSEKIVNEERSITLEELKVVEKKLRRDPEKYKDKLITKEVIETILEKSQKRENNLSEAKKIVNLEAVVWSGENSMVMIDGKIFKKGDKVDKFVIVDINQDGIVLNDGSDDIVMNIHKYDKDEQYEHLHEIIDYDYKADDLVHRTRDYVLEYLGKPNSINRHKARDYFSESWCYVLGYSSIVINFDSQFGNVTSVSVQVTEEGA